MGEEKYSEEVKNILQAAQQQAVMNYNQEFACAHVLVAMCGQQDGFFKFLLTNMNIDEKVFSNEAKALVDKFPSVKGQDGLRMSIGLVWQEF